MSIEQEIAIKAVVLTFAILWAIGAARETEAPPSHIKCPRCAGVAVARGRAEVVQPTETRNDD